jgi:hypothetical protein
MSSKYALAKQVNDELVQQAQAAAIDVADVQQATLVLLVQALKSSLPIPALKSFLQYEIDNLGSGNVFEVPRGGGHS